MGGLATAIELRAIGAQVSVFERSAGTMQVRGAGIVMQPEVEHLLQRIGSSADSISVPLSTRQRMDSAGHVSTYAAPQLMTSWGALYGVLRRSLDAGISYALNRELVQIEEQDGQIRSEFADGFAVESDLLVGADGIGSAVRREVGIDAVPDYAGYVAWRGLEPEASLAAELIDIIDDSFTFFAIPGMQFLSYLVPGPGGETTRGNRQVNWVWYINTSQHILNQLLVSVSGRRYRSFLPPDEVSPQVRTSIDSLAELYLPPPLRDVVTATRVFMQPVIDVPLSEMRRGRTVLVGDAVGTVRPHTASGTSKAFADARSLASALTGWQEVSNLPVAALRAWENHRAKSLKLLDRTGKELASESMLGTEPTYMGDGCTGEKSSAMNEAEE